MVKGVSIYLGLEKTLAENLKLMAEAAKLGYTKVFLSLHLPEADKKQVEEELSTVVTTAHHLGLQVIGDVEAANQIDASIDEVRLDDGFNPQDVANFLCSKPSQTVVLNASTLTREFLEELEELRVPWERVTALHNFYPRPHTGLSEVFFASQNALLAAYGIPVGAFVPSQVGKRAPFHRGLPTLEKDRLRPVAEAAEELVASGMQTVIIGDDGPSWEELQALEVVLPKVWELTLADVDPAPWAQAFLTKTFTVRPDAAQDVIRALESRDVAKPLVIEPCSSKVRPVGTVTVDNALGGRYKGELEIVKTSLPPAPEVNVLGHLTQDACHLLPYLTPGAKFRLKV